MREIRAIVVHCSATANGDARVTWQTLDEMHRAKGWKKIGYHYVIHCDGMLYAGRDLAEVGAHVEGNNAHTIGICVIGTNRFSIEQWEQLRDLVNNLQLQFQNAEVYGHRDYSPDLNGDNLIEPWEWFKICPGFDVKKWLLSGKDPMWDPAHIYSGGE